MFPVVRMYRIDVLFDFTVIFTVNGEKSIFMMIDVVITGKG